MKTCGLLKRIHRGCFDSWLNIATSSSRKDLPSSKLTWQWKIPVFNREYIFNRFIFHCHVSLPEATFLYPFWGDLKSSPHEIFCWNDERINATPVFFFRVFNIGRKHPFFAWKKCEAKQLELLAALVFWQKVCWDSSKAYRRIVSQALEMVEIYTTTTPPTNS